MSEVSIARFWTCLLCGCTKPQTAEFFYRDKQTRSGLRYDCKVCRQVHRNTKRQANIEFYRERDRGYESAAHRKAKRREYVENNREIYREACRKWRENNPGKQVELTRAYQKANPHKKREVDKRRRARKLGAECVPYTASDINDMWHNQGGCCYYCDMPVFALYHVDHKTPLSRGGADKLENLCVACPTCNNRKKDKTEQEFAEYRVKRYPAT